jgi:gliding motility-associated-like protein
MRRILFLLAFAFALINTASAQTITMTSGTVNGCSGTILDPGGAANYPMNCNNTMTFCSNAGNCVQLSFTQFNIESGWDYLYVYNGPTTGSPQMTGSPFTGTALPPVLTSTSGCITIRFTSDGVINAPGFSANISCVTCPPPPPPPIVASDCAQAANICSNASFSVDPNGFGAVNELPSGSVVNPSTNPSGVNTGCLLSGELNSTWMVVNIASNGNLQFSIGAPGTGCLDWIMFPYNPATTCNAISSNSIAPVTCNWNGACNGFTGMASPIPAGGNASNFQPPLNVTCGQQYLICLSNYSSLTTTLPLNFFGTATVSCVIVSPTTVNNATICVGQSATLTANATGATSYSWAPATGLSATTGASVTASPSTTTTYTVTSTGSCGSSTATATVTVNLAASVTVNSATICAGSSATLTATPGTAGGTYSWSPGGATTSSITVTPAVTTSYTCTYTRLGCVGTATGTVTVNPRPVITAPANISVCAGSAVAAQAFTSTPAGATYAWTNSNPAIGLPANGAGSVSGFTATNTGASPITATITVTPTLGPCPGTPITYTITVNPQPLSTYTQSANQCLTGNTFTFNNTGSSGAGYVYSWTFAGGTPASATTNNAAGVTFTTVGAHTITHTVTAPGGCTSTTTSSITIYPMPTGLTATTGPTTCGASNGTITITTGVGGTGPYTYSVNGGAFSGTLNYTGQTAGSHPIIVRDANGCQFSTTVTVGASPGPTALATTTVNSTCGASNGVINIGAVTGGTAAYTYSVNGGAFTSTTSHIGFAAGTYTVIVRDANGCTFTTAATIVNTPGPTALATSTVNASCGASNGVINIGAVTGGTAAYTYSVNGGAFTSTTSYTGLAAGTYTVIVRDANGCTFTTSATIINNAGPTALAHTHVNATCGASNGTITLGAVTGGSGPYTYSVNGSAFSSTTNYTGFAAGTYTLIVRDVNGCTFTTTVTITNASGPTALAITSTNSTCGASNGTVTIGATTGGTAPYTYSFNGGAFTGTTNYTTLAAGTYSIVVRDASGCTFTTSIVVVNTAGPTALAVATINANCGTATGSINIGAVTGGVAPYTYSLNAGAFTATTAYSSLAAGTYTVIVRDVNGCTFTATAIIGNNPGPTALAVTTVNSSCGASNGVVNIGAVTGGTAAYTYSLNGGAFTSTTSYTGLAAGTYTVVVRDVNGCTFSTTATIINSPGPTALATSTVNSTCGASNGTVNVGAVTGGTAAYVYSFNGSAFTSTTSYTGLAAGTYTIIVRDANGCTFTVTATVANSPGPTALATSVTNASCGASNGSITIGAVTGGTAAYTYSVNGSAFTATTSYTGFAAGTYSVVVRDANGCTFTTSATINNASGPTALAVSSTNASCGSSTGTATIGAVTGGIAPYTYSFNGSAFTSTTSYTALASGTYSVIVRDANGCTYNTSVTVGSNAAPTALVTTTTNSTCGAANGVINIGAVTGGFAPYTYSVNGSPFTTTTTYGSMLAGTYTVIVRDVNGCQFSTTATIINSPGPTALAVATVNSTCGATNGVINIGVVTGGSPSYTYSVNGSAFTTTTSYTGFGAGTYTVIVRDANNCTFSTTATVVNTPGPTALATTTVNSTCGASNGTVNIGAVTGGTPAYVYSFNGSAFSATTTYSGIAAGTYAVIVRDANGCTFTVNPAVTNTPGPTALATTFTNPTCGASNGTITLGATTGGTAAYTYSFNGGGFTSTTNYTGLAAGTYTIIVEDANGCQFTATRVITNVPGPTALATSTTNAACGASTGTITIGATTGGTPAYTYSVNGSPFTTTTNYTGIAANTYPVIVQDANGCQFTTSATVANSSGPTALAVNTTNAACGASTGTISVGATTGGLAPYSYSVNGSAFTTTTNYTGFAAGTYTVIVRDANGCSFSTSAVVNPTTGPTALAVTTVNATCGASNGTITMGAVTGGTAPYMYSVNASSFTATTTYTGFAAGTYNVIVQDVNGCQFATTATIINIPGPTAIAITTTNTTCGVSNGSVVLGAVTGGTPAYTYSFAGSAFTTTTTYSALAAGTYAIVVRDANGCTYTTSAVLINTPGPTALATTFTNPTCGASNGTITIGATTGGTPTYTYSFNGGGFTSTTSYTGLAAGTYPIIVEDANGCQFSISRIITNVAGPTALATSTTNASCGAATGTATIGAVTGGTAPYTYSFNGGAFASTTSFTGLAANSYPVIVQDANGCQFTTSATVANSSGPTALAVTFTDATCGASNGTATIGATTGGVLPLSYSFNGGAFSTTTNYTALAAGTYAVIVRDANGCTFTTSVTISNIAGPTALAVTSVNTTCGAANGSISVGAVTGGTPAYTYSVNASAFTATTNYTALVAGTYNIVVRDANACTFTTTATITDTPGPTALATTITNSTCGNSNGAVSLGAVTGGTPAYTYSFAGSAFTSTISYTGLAAGSYNIVVSDVNGCTFNTTANITNTPGPTGLATTVTNSTCGSSNGTITIGATTGGTPTYMYAFNGGGFTSTTSYTGLAAGTYPIIVQDANGCTFTVNPSFTNIQGPTALATSTTNASCGAATGTATIGAVTGGTAPYTYSFNGGAFASTTSFTGLAANSYPVIVQDANGCQFTTSATVANSSGPTALAVTFTDATCGASNGTATIGATTGGVLPLSYSFNGGAFSTTTNYTALAAGTYAVIVRDANGCTFTTSVTISNIAGPTALAVTSVNTTCGAANGSISVGAVTGGTPAYTYSVNASAFTATTNYTALVAGTYNIVVRDANACTFTTTATITDTPGPTALATTITNSTCGNSNGAVSLGAVTGGTPAYTYSFAGSAFTSTISYTGLAAGSYNIVVSDVNGCTFNTTANITNTPGPTGLATTTVSSTCGSSNGTVNVGLTTGGTAPYMYSFDGGGFTSTINYTGLTAGAHTVIVQDANGCTFTVNPVVTNVTGPTAQATTVTNSTCGGANGAVTIGATTGGTPPYVYSVNGSVFTATTSYTGLVANTYPVIVQDANGCQFTTSATVIDLSGLTASVTSQANVGCNGGSNGSVTVTASGSTAPYSYALGAGTFVGSGVFSGLAAGTYTVIAKDANGCTFTVPITITEPSVLTGVIASQTNITCFNGTNGAVTISAAGGTTPAYTYSIDGGVFGSSATFTGLSAGSHPVIVKDANGCTVNVAVTITQPTALTLATSSSNATCVAFNGSATVTATGATPLYTYLWAPGGQATATASSIQAGNYSVLVTDFNGCTQTANVTVGINTGGNATISSSNNVSCIGANDGSATVSMGAGATPAFTYAWNPSSQTGVTATNLGPGSYTVTVTDGNGCIATTSTVITQPTIITNTLITNNISCNGGNNGSITVNSTGGSPGYDYFWTPGGYTTQTVASLPAGTYSCVITDTNGCTSTVSTTLTEPTAIAISETHIDANCNQSNGSAIANASGGTGPYAYSWSTSPVQATDTATGLAANTYVVTVTDFKGCVQTLAVNIGDLAGPVATIFSSNNVSCNGLTDGSATVTMSGGTPPFDFLWTNGQTLPTATNLTAGTYTLNVLDDNGCAASTSITITEPAMLDASVVTADPSCNNSCDGSFVSTAFGGTPAYSYLWSPGGATTPNVTGLCDGTYTLQVTDAEGCVALETVVLFDPPAVSATVTTVNVTCNGLCNGSATANPGAGTGPFTYLWNDINAQTTQTAAGLCSGTYTVTVTDANGCSTTAVANITTPNAMAASIIDFGNVTCYGACDGYAQASVTGGSAPFIFNWMPGGTAGASVNNLCAAAYTVTVTDVNGCTATTNVNIVQPNALVATITNTDVTCYGACDAQATAVYTGGTGPYTFVWTPTVQTTPTAVALCAGVHSLAMTDSMGCTATASVVITEPTILAVTTTTTNSDCGNANGTACAAIVGGSPPFIYAWSDPATQATSCAAGLNAGAYTISVTDSHGCSVTNVANVNDNGAPVVTVPVSSNVTCFGAANGSAQGNITGGILPYTINWTPGSQTTLFASNLPGGIYSIVVTDSVGCIGSASVTINEPTLLVSAIIASDDVSCFLSCDGSATVLAGGGTAPYTYLWNDGALQTTAAANGLCAQSYTTTIEDANGCTTSSSVTIGEPTPLVISLVSTTNVSCNGGNNGEINITVAGGTPGYTYTWTPSVGSGPIVTNLTAGTYSVLVTDASGCTKIAIFDIIEPNALVLTPNSNSSTCGNADGSAGVTVTGGVVPYLYSWTPTGATSSIITNVVAGVYSVLVTDGNGCNASASSTVTDIAAPVITSILFTPPLCNGTPTGTATVIASGGVPLYSYLWTGPGAQTSQTATAFPAGTYSVTVSDANHCTVTGSVILTEPDSLQIVMSPTDTICIGQLTQIYGVGYGGTLPYTAYNWIPATLTGSGPITVNPVTTTTYQAYVTDANGCISSMEPAVVFVNAQIQVIASDVSVCSGDSVLISAAATGGNGGPYTYSWDNGINTASQYVTPIPGSSTVNYVVTANDIGCSQPVVDTSTVTVNPLAVAFISTPVTSGCEDFNLTFNGFSNIGIAYSWNFGDGSPVQTGDSPEYIYTNPGTYDVTLTVTTALGCVSTVTNTAYITVFPAPVAGFSTYPQQATTTAPQIDFTDLSIGANDWDWDFIYPTGLYTDTLQNPSFSYPDSGIYIVQQVVYNSFGCSDTAYNSVEIVPEYVIYAPNAFTPNNHDGVNDTFMPKGVGIDPDNFEMFIFDRWGNQIYKTTDITKGWDGTANGGSKVAQIDVYVWKIKTKDFRGEDHSYVGHVTIVK